MRARGLSQGSSYIILPQAMTWYYQENIFTVHLNSACSFNRKNSEGFVTESDAQIWAKHWKDMIKVTVCGCFIPLSASWGMHFSSWSFHSAHKQQNWMNRNHCEKRELSLAKTSVSIFGITTCYYSQLRRSDNRKVATAACCKSANTSFSFEASHSTCWVERFSEGSR